MQLSTVDHKCENLHMFQCIVRPQIHFWSDYKCSFCCFISCFTILYSNVIRIIEWFRIHSVTTVHMWYTICKMWMEWSTVCDLGLLQSQFSISNNSIGYTEPYRKRCRLTNAVYLQHEVKSNQNSSNCIPWVLSIHFFRCLIFCFHSINEQMFRYYNNETTGVTHLDHFNKTLHENLLCSLLCMVWQIIGSLKYGPLSLQWI